MYKKTFGLHVQELILNGYRIFGIVSTIITCKKRQK